MLLRTYENLNVLLNAHRTTKNITTGRIASGIIVVVIAIFYQFLVTYLSLVVNISGELL